MTNTNIADLGEFGLIDHLTKNFKPGQSSIIKGIGDDCAVVEKDEANYTLITTDLLVEGIHFDIMYTPLKHLGYKAVVANLSDIYAMNGTPHYITVSIAISSKYTVEAVEEIYKGIYLACHNYKIDLIGGDTTSSLKGMFISITAIGQVAKEKVVYRTGAVENDLLCVTGDLGAAFMGLQMLEREKQVYLDHPDLQPDLEHQQYIIGRQLKPEARKDVIRILAEKNVQPTAMIDVSDGLSSEIQHLCKLNTLGATIYEEKIPIHSDTYEMAVKMGIDPVTTYMNGGEDYELLFTISQANYEAIKDEYEISVIGHMTHASMGMSLITKAGTKVDITPKGWNAFRNKS
jgi:thiamine-monophosphate kinase